MACGLPVVTTRVGKRRGRPQPDLGTLVPFGDPLALTTALGDIATNVGSRSSIAYAQANAWDGRIDVLVTEFARLANVPAPDAAAPIEAHRA
jgi:hypothetical protein